MTPAERDALERRQARSRGWAIAFGIATTVTGGLAIAAFVTAHATPNTDGMAASTQILVEMFAGMLLGSIALLLAVVTLGFAASARR